MDCSRAIASLLLVIFAIILLALNMAGEKLVPTAYGAEPTYEYQLYEWVDKLVMDESGGREDIQIVDSNSAYSRGCGMFQDKTWEAYTEKYNMTHLNVFNCSDVKLLIYTMIYDYYNNWAHWRCSVVDTKDSELCTAAFKKMGWPPKEGIGKPPLRDVRQKYPNADKFYGPYIL